MRAFIKLMFSAEGKFRIEEFARDWLKEHNPDRTEMINALQVSRCDVVYVAYGFAALSSGGHAHTMHMQLCDKASGSLACDVNPVLSACR